MSRSSAFVIGIAVGAAVAVAAILVGPWGDQLVPDRVERVNAAIEAVEDRYWRQTDLEQLENSSVQGIVNRLRKRYDDRFSHYFDPQSNERFQAATSGEFSGVGLTVSEVRRGLRVSGVFEDAPAERAGIEEGDLIVGVDGRSIAGQSADVATARIKGREGTKVELQVVDAESGKKRTVEVERARVRVPAVDGRMIQIGGRDVAYVAMATFSEGSHGELREQVERLYDRGAEGLILDLRGNGGGLLEEAVLSASIFVEDGVIVTTDGRTQPKRVYRAVGDAIDEKPTVVLVNGDTASAAEILASALQGNDVATVVGSRTFGKGVFQEVIELPGGAALDLTVGEYLTAEGESLAGEGLAPDVRERDRPRRPGDESLRRARQVLGEELASGS